jgi:hypothetical protein
MQLGTPTSAQLYLFRGFPELFRTQPVHCKVMRQKLTSRFPAGVNYTILISVFSLRERQGGIVVSLCWLARAVPVFD